MQRVYAGLGMCVALLGVFAGSTAQATVITFGGQTWDVLRDTNATATKVGDDLQVEFTGTTGGEYWLHVNRVVPDINVNGTPFISFSFIVDAIAPGDQFLVDIFIDDEGGANPTDLSRSNPRHEANFIVNNTTSGSLVQSVLGTEKYTLSGSTQEAQFGNLVTGGLGIERTLSIGKLPDGSVEYNLDGSVSQSSFLKFNYGDTGFEFGDVYLRIRDWTSGDGVAGGGKVTFTNFHTSATPVPEPGTMTLLGIGGVGLLGGYFRRRKVAA